jgi:outer membrane lipoprotein-sorting protein
VAAVRRGVEPAPYSHRVRRAEGRAASAIIEAGIGEAMAMRRKWIGLAAGLVAVVVLATWAILLRPPKAASAEEVARKTHEKVAAIKSYYAHEVGETIDDQGKRRAIDRQEWFRAPNLRRLEQTKPFKMTAVADGKTLRAYYPDHDLLLISDASTLLLDTLLPQERCRKNGWSKDSVPCLKSGARLEGREKVDGHACLVLKWEEPVPPVGETTAGASESEGQHKDTITFPLGASRIVMRTWVDEKLMLPRKEEVRFGEGIRHWSKLAALRVNQRIPDARFRWQAPAAKHVVKGNFSPDAVESWWSYALSQREGEGGWGEVHSGALDFTVLRPGYVPKGARWVSSCEGGERTDTETPTWWTGAIVPETGASLTIVERKARGSLPEGKAQAIGKYKGVLTEQGGMAASRTLVWDQGGTRVRLRGWGFDLDELLKLAAAMRPGEFVPSPPPGFEGPPSEQVSVEEAQRRVDFVIYLPTHLPAGAGAADVSVSRGGESPQGGHFDPQINVNYTGTGGWLHIFEMYRSAGETVGGKREVIKWDSVIGEYSEEMGSLEFTLGTTGIDLDGVGKDELVRVAKSMKPAAPQIKPLPHKEFGPWGEEGWGLSIEEAQRKADFRIYLPKWMPEGGGEPRISWTPFKGFEDGGWQPNQVSISYPDSKQLHVLEQYAEWKGARGPMGAEKVKVRGREARLWPADEDGERTLSLVLGHTEVDVGGDLGKEELIRIAASLEPVATHVTPAVHKPLPKPRVESLSPEEAQRKAGFVLYDPGRLPRGYKRTKVSGVLQVSEGRPSRLTQVVLEYRSGKSRIAFAESAAGPARGQVEAGLEELELAPGQKAWLLRHEGKDSLAVLTWTVGGSEIAMFVPGALSRGKMLEIARSTRPLAPKEAREKGLVEGSSQGGASTW